MDVTPAWSTRICGIVTAPFRPVSGPRSLVAGRWSAACYCSSVDALGGAYVNTAGTCGHAARTCMRVLLSFRLTLPVQSNLNRSTSLAVLRIEFGVLSQAQTGEREPLHVRACNLHILQICTFAVNTRSQGKSAFTRVQSALRNVSDVVAVRAHHDLGTVGGARHLQVLGRQTGGLHQRRQMQMAPPSPRRIAADLGRLPETAV